MLLIPEVTELFFDVESGNSNERKQFNKMLKLVEEGKIETVVATRWDRITRNQTLYLQLKKILRDCDVTLHLLDQGEVDFSTASGELNADMQVIFAFHERNMLRERVKKGNEYRRKRQAACGRAP